MAPSWIDVLVLLTALGSGIIGGAFFAFSTFVMAALERLPPPQGIAAMQRINLSVINPWFLSVFLGTAVGGFLVAALGLREGQWLYLAGGLLYAAGCFGVTIVFNVPQNNALAVVDPSSEEGAQVWANYLIGWTRWNTFRTVCALAGAIALVVGWGE